MKKLSIRLLFYLCIMILFIVSACGVQATEEPAVPDSADVQTAEVVTDTQEEPPELAEVNLDELLDVGSAIEWYDDAYLVYVPKGEVTMGDSDSENN